MRRLTTREIQMILEPSFKSTVDSLGLQIPTDSQDLERKDLLKALKQYNPRKVFRIFKDLIDRGKIKEYIVEEQGEEDIGVNDIDAKIRSLVNGRLLLRIETREMKLQLSPTYKLLITPLGICFLYCYRKGLFPGRNLDENISRAQELLGSIYEDFIEEETQGALRETKVSLSRKEIAITMLMLLHQALTPDKALKISKSERQRSLSRLTKALNTIGKRLFNESNLFVDPQETGNALRRSTAVDSLGGKMSGLYSKVSVSSEERLFFNCSNEEDLSSIVSQLCDGIKNEEKKNDTNYRKNAIELVDGHIRDHTSFFPPWERRKILDHEIETMYLTKLMGLIKKNLS